MKGIKGIIGEKVGHATVIASTRAKLPTPTGKRPKGKPEPWGDALMVSDTSVILAFSIPVKELWPNTRVHWGKKARAVKAHRACAAEIAAWAATRVAGFPWEQVVATRRFYFPDLRRRDQDNAEASLKALWDGIVEGGLLSDDGSRMLSYDPSVFDVDRVCPRVEITLKRVPTEVSQ